MSDVAQDAGTLPALKSRTAVAAGFLVEEFDIANLGPGRSAPFEMSLFRIEPQCESTPEAHDDAELWLVAAGVGQMFCGERVLDVYPGRVISIDPGVTHKVVNTGDVALQIFSVWWMYR
jgi:mannose-6-phosphate isomerase-like protein (cupin superfamily)